MNAKKLISLVLALVLVLAISATAMAANTTLTINTTNGHTYTVYQLLEGEVTNLSGGSGTLSNTKAGANAVDGKTVDEILAALKDKDGNYLSGAELGDAAYALIDTQSEAATVIGNGNAQQVTVANGYYVVTDAWTNGAIAGETLSRYLVAVVGATEMQPKATTVDIDKKIVDESPDTNAALDTVKKTNTAAIGDEIKFEITGTVPNTEGYKYFYYVAHDTMSKGLTLDQTSFVVTVGTGANASTLTKDTDYYVYATTDEDTGVTTFELAFEDMKKLVDDKTIAVGEAISITYTATVNDKADIGVKPNTNDVYPIYSNNPGSSERNDKKDDDGEPIPGLPEEGTATGEGPNKTTKTYVTELTIQKVDNNGMPLAGAEFTLTGTNLNKVIVTTDTEFRTAATGETAEYYELNNGTFTTAAPTETTYKVRTNETELSQLYEKNDDEYVLTTDTELDTGKTYYVVNVLTNRNLYKNPDAPTHVRVTNTATSTEATGTPKTIKGTVDAAGLITFTGLNAGTYTLTETKTPSGYNTIAPIEFTISAAQSGSTAITGGDVTWASNNEEIVLDGTNGVFDATIVNLPGSSLPTTGGMGTTMIYIAGGLLVAAAVILLITKRRAGAAE